MSGIGIDELGYDERLYILAFDHRGSFEKMVGDVEQRAAGAKRLIWEGFQRAVEEGAPKEYAGILVDAQYGPDVAREAKAGGYKLAMPVEKIGPEGVRLRVRRAVRREDRGVRPGLLEGARPLQPGRRPAS